MKDHYEFTKTRPNPYAERMKKGYSVAIHYETPEDAHVESAQQTIRNLLAQPGLNSIHLYLKSPATPA